MQIEDEQTRTEKKRTWFLQTLTHEHNEHKKQGT